MKIRRKQLKHFKKTIWHTIRSSLGGAGKLKDLETRLEEMRAQVKQREDAAEKYVEAAMTMANLHAQGISYAPPRPAPPDPQTNDYPMDNFTRPISSGQPPFPSLPPLRLDPPRGG